MILIDMEMPKGCVDCPFCKGCKSPKDFPFIDCKFIGRIGSMFNFEQGKPVDCPLKEYKQEDSKCTKAD